LSKQVNIAVSGQLASSSSAKNCGKPFAKFTARNASTQRRPSSEKTQRKTVMALPMILCILSTVTKRVNGNASVTCDNV
jgi:hypothetical protein